MASFVFANFIKTTLAASLSSSATSMSVADAVGIPSLSAGEQLGFVLNDAATGLLFEVVYVTGVSGTTLTILRGQEETSAQNWNVGDYVANTVTASQLAAMVQGTGSQFAPAAGNGSQVFAVADATAATQQAVPIIQADARYAPIAGSSGQTFEVADATAAHQATSLEQIQATYAPLISPALTGTPTAPTASVGTNTTQIATTAFVLANQGAPDWAAPGTIGSTTPNTGAFTTLSASSLLTASNGFTVSAGSISVPNGSIAAAAVSGTAWTQASLTALSQLSNNAGYITASALQPAALAVDSYTVVNIGSTSSYTVGNTYSNPAGLSGTFRCMGQYLNSSNYVALFLRLS